MLIYTLLMAIILVLGYIKPNNSKTKRKIYLITVFGLLIFISAMRSQNVGTDLRNLYSHYYSSFKHVEWRKLQNVTKSGHWELGFCILCKCLCYVTTDIQFFIFVTSVLAIVPYAIFIYYNSEDVVFSSFFYLAFHIYTIGLNLVRQPIAVGIIIIGLGELKRKHYLRFAIFVLLASLIHVSALIALLLILLDKIRFNRNSVVKLTIFTILIILGYSHLFSFLLKYTKLSEKYGFYEIGVKHAAGYITIHTLGMAVVPLFILIVCILYYNNDSNYSEKNFFMIKRRILKLKGTKLRFGFDKEIIYWSEDILIYVCYIVMILRIGAFIINVSSRMSYYFIPFLMIAFPHAINKVSNYKNKLIINSIIYFGLIVFFFYIGIFQANRLWGVTPYEFCFQLK